MRLGTKQLRADVSHLWPRLRKRPLVTRVTCIQPEERQIVTETRTKNYQPPKKKEKNQRINEYERKNKNKFNFTE